MKKELLIWQLTGLVFTAVLGTLLHFLFGWTNTIFVAPFSAVNESTWEHMKIMFFPTFIFALIQNIFYYKDFCNFWKIKFFGIILSLFLIPILFYTFSGAFGKSTDCLNILFYFISAFCGFALEYFLFKSKERKPVKTIIYIVILIVIALLFFIFTFITPKLPLFLDPITKTYGI